MVALKDTLLTDGGASAYKNGKGDFLGEPLRRKPNLWESSHMDRRPPTYYIDRWIIREYFMEDYNLRGGCSSAG
jgi:hypothetical protein